jgi:hypothetical protein
MDKLKHPINLDNITDEQAINATIEMWSDMLGELYEKPLPSVREIFKKEWLEAHEYVSTYPGIDRVSSDCFLCECAGVKWRNSGYRRNKCDYCPIVWPNDRPRASAKCVSNHLDYRRSSLSDILDYLENKEHWRP